MYTFTVTATGTKRVRINDDAPEDVKFGSDPNHLTISKLADKPAGSVWEIDLEVNGSRRRVRAIRPVEGSTTAKPQSRAGPEPKAVDAGIRETVDKVDEPPVLIPNTGKASAAETLRVPSFSGLTAVFNAFSIEEILDQYVRYKLRQVISDLERHAE